VVNPGYPNVIAARDDTDDTPKDVEMPDDINALKVALYVYNPVSLSWERGRQGQISPLYEDRPADERYAYNASDNMIYYGWNKTLNASEAATDWYIIRQDWSGSNLTRRRHAVGAWSNRTNLWS
jgi:hypothetical protein